MKFLVPLLSALLFALAGCQTGCGATCDRINEDRTQFLDRAAKNHDTHAEITIPFALVEGLVAPYVTQMKPVPFNLSSLGQLSQYFGELSVVPRTVSLQPAPLDHIGFHLDFEVLRNGRRAFGMFTEIEVKPEIDLSTGKISIGFTPEALQTVKPGLSDDAADELTNIIYGQIPPLARLAIPREMAMEVVSSTLENLVTRFYDKYKDRLLEHLAHMSKLEVALPSMPLAAVSLTSTEANDGYLRIGITTALPVPNGLMTPTQKTDKAQPNLISLRLTAATAAEVVNWAMKQKIVPDRYDDKGKPKEDGELRPGVAWVAGDEQPMKVYLWDLEKPCMRLTLSAKPSVAVIDDKLVIKATEPETDDIEASAFTKVGVWFYLLWKDPMQLGHKQNAKLKLVVAGKPLEAALKSATLKNDEFKFDIQLSTGQ